VAQRQGCDLPGCIIDDGSCDGFVIATKFSKVAGGSKKTTDSEGGIWR
jgi:hypothetical protein